MTRAPKTAAIALAGVLVTMPAMSGQNKPAEAGGVLLSLHEAVLEALARNPELLNTRVATDQAALALRVAQSAWSTQILPTMSGAFGRTTLSNQAYGLDVSKRLTTGTQLRGLVSSTSYQNQFGTYFNSDMTLQVTQPLLRGFGRTASRGQPP